MDERVLVVPADDLDRLGRFQGFRPDGGHGLLEALLRPGRAGFRPRREVEDDPGFKQIIPYVVFRSGGLVFSYARGQAGAEARLRRLRSIGVGGHVAEEDAGGRASVDAYEAALARELAEEVEVASPGTLRRVGLVNDDANPVGRVHLGVVHLFDLDHPAVRPLEAALVDPQFLAIDTLRAQVERLETWSQMVLETL